MTDAPVRIESDLLGALSVPASALYGIHTQRALENFPLSGRPVNRHLVHAYGQVKLACLRTNHELCPWPAEKLAALEQACHELADGQLDEHVVVDALQGGAGTSTNMNVNEVLANRALQLCGHPLGTYTWIHPLDDVSRHQSTNDTYPTALRVAAIGQLRGLEREATALLEAFQRKEREFANDLRLLASGPDAGLGELCLPPRQAGSSLMPGKVNPVIPEAVAQASLVMTAHDQLRTQACGLGNLELNQFLPLIADSLLTSLDLARRACRVFAEHCIRDLTADVARCARHVDGTIATITALVDRLGYAQAQEVVQHARRQGTSIRHVLLEQQLLSAAEFAQAVAPAAVTRLESPLPPQSEGTGR